MIPDHEKAIYEQFIDYLARFARPEEILAFRASEAENARAQELIDRKSMDDLSPDEQAELSRMLDEDRLISVLKARAMKAVDSQ